eukprot:213524-Karenia_brevis.AAC.1
MSPPGEKQSNGAAEENGKTCLGMALTMLEMVCDKVGETLPDDCPFVQWVIRWAAMVLSRFVKGSDNRTAYERTNGRECNQEVIAIGECMLFRPSRNTDDRKRVVGESWRKGIWLGHVRGSADYLIGTDEGVVRSWSVKRSSPGEQWNLEALKSMKGTPARPNPEAPGITVPIKITMPLPRELREPIIQMGVQLKAPPIAAEDWE